MAWAKAHLVRTTFASEGEAQAAARDLVETRLAACCHVARVASTYVWDGRLEAGAEWLLEARTVGTANQAVQRLRATHPFDLPLLEVVEALVAPEYGQWARTGRQPRARAATGAPSAQAKPRARKAGTEAKPPARKAGARAKPKAAKGTPGLAGRARRSSPPRAASR